jgi:hypothetical protein
MCNRTWPYQLFLMVGWYGDQDLDTCLNSTEFCQSFVQVAVNGFLCTVSSYSSPNHFHSFLKKHIGYFLVVI